jgi:hypothetical protein
MTKAGVLSVVVVVVTSRPEACIKTWRIAEAGAGPTHTCS